MKNRILFTLIVFGLFWLVLLARSIDLQILPHKRLSELKQKLFEKTLRIKPRRGIIYDRHGKELAISISSESLFVDPKTVDKPYFLSRKLAQLFGKSQTKLLKKIIDKKRRFLWIKHHLTEKEYKTVKSWKLKGLYFIREPKRFYTKGSSLSQVLGFTGVDNQGLEGIEKKYDEILQGSEQRFMVKRDARGRPLFADFSSVINRVSGFNIYLTIDNDLQFYLEKELHQAVKKSSAQSALGVILDAQTSEVLAMANTPNYNPNTPLKFSGKHRRNRVVTDIYEPGSTLKTFTIAAALEQGIPPYKTYSSAGGSLELNGEVIKEADTKKKFQAQLNMSDILSLSSNIGAAKIALAVGDKKLRETLKNLGFGARTNLAFLGEASGILRKLPWRDIETATVGFGHGIATTAIQIVMAYNAIANGGLLKEPVLVKKIKNPYTGEERHFKTRTLRRVLSERTSQILTSMLANATDRDATGFRARVSGYLSAGKTGTAQKVDFKTGGYKTNEYISSFSGFIPAYKPKFVIYVVIDGAKDNFYASSVAAPVFAEAASYLVRKAGLSPAVLNEKDFIASQEVEIKRTERKLASVGRMPDLENLSLREAMSQVKGLGVKLKVQGSRRVVRTIPASGKPLPSNKEIKLFLR